ncbi:MAG TPA: hypothetical protein PK268_04415 [Enterococcus sp.]|nr:hypothetical protein [Enterococcus sp.]
MCKLSDVLLVIDLQIGVCQDNYQLQKLTLLVNQRMNTIKLIKQLLLFNMVIRSSFIKRKIWNSFLK